MTTLLAGENYPLFTGSFIQVSGGGPHYEEVDLSGASQFNAFSVEKRLVLGVRYWGTTAGLLYYVDADDELTSITFKDSSQFGIQEAAIQAKTIYNQGAAGAPTDIFPVAGDKLGIYMTKVVTV